MPLDMQRPKIAVPSRPPIVIAVLVLAAIVFFVAVAQLVQGFKRHESRLAQSLYGQGESEMKSGHPERAVADFRAALAYGHENPQYQLSLARALRDTGRLDEAESYLQRLWEQHPDDSEVNLALARLAVKRGSLPDVLRYYHNAIYGVWPSDPDNRRVQARLELTQFLIQQHAYNQAQSELIVLAPQLPSDPDLHIRVAQMFYQAQDYQHAFEEYAKVLRLRRGHAVALAGAGRSAFQLGHYRSAVEYLDGALRNLKDPDLHNLLEISRLVLQLDPYARRIPDAERVRRLRAALDEAEQRQESCSQSNVLPAGGTDLETQLHELQKRVKRIRPSGSSDLTDDVMDLVVKIENQPCGPPTPEDRALMLIAQNPTGVDR